MSKPIKYIFIDFNEALSSTSEVQQQLESSTLEPTDAPPPAHTPPVGENGLPSGWEGTAKRETFCRIFHGFFLLERTDPRTGRTYYVDHNSHRTTWEKPTEPSVPAPSENQVQVAALTAGAENSGNNFLPGNPFVPLFFACYAFFRWMGNAGGSQWTALFYRSQ